MNKYLKEAFNRNKKFFFSNLSATVFTFAGFKVALWYFDYPLNIYWSIALGIWMLVTVVSITLNIVIKEELDSKQHDIEKYIMGQSKPYNRSRGDYHIYGKDIVYLKEGFAHLHRIRKEKSITNEDLSVALSVLCENLKKAFDEGGKDKRYAACIKLFEKEHDEKTKYEDLEVRMYCGDEFSREDRELHYSKVSVLKEESCYGFLLNRSSNKFYYLNNNVIKTGKYKSSYFDTYRLPDGINVDQLEKEWRLPYRSELVVPICPVHTKEMPFNRRNEVLGFLCIDCDQTGGFHPEYDVPMIEGVADGIYDLIPLVRKLALQTTTESNQTTIDNSR